MRGMTLGHAANNVLLLLLVVWLFVILIRGIRQNPQDRVFWFEALAFMSGSLGVVTSYFWHSSAFHVSVFFMILFLIFAALAGYCAVMNRVHRKKKAT